MAYEVEMKFRVEDHSALASRLAMLGVLASSPDAQDDYYIAHPSRDFARTDEAVRLRRVGESNFLTYKGPKLGGPTKTRREIEVAFADGPEARARMIELFQLLGFGPILEVRKTRLTFRITYRGRPMVVTLDRVEDQGAFAEVEAMAVSETDLALAQESVQALAAELDLRVVEPRSYLRMALERLEPGPGPAGGSPAGPG
jgi:adenylate cyclase class 2